MKATIHIVAEYDIPDDPAERLRLYETTDPHKCAELDRTVNMVEEMLEISKLIDYRIEVAG